MGTDAASDARSLDLYGDHYAPGDRHDAANANAGVALLSNPMVWGPRPFDGARYYQVRVTLRSNPVTGDSPEVSSIGVGWPD